MVDDVNHVNEVQIHGVRVLYEHFKHVERLDKCAFNVEQCCNMNEFLLLAKMDFEREKMIKRCLFGKEFENMDCPDLMRTYLRAITLGQTFNDEFTFVSLCRDYIPCSAMHSKKRRSMNVTMSPCELAKMCLMMMAFIHNEVARVLPFADIYDSDFHEHVRVYFHDRLIEWWMCEIDLDNVSKIFLNKQSAFHAMQCKKFIKQNIFIIFDQVTWNDEGGERRLVVYVYNGDYLTANLRKELVRFDQRMDNVTFAVNHLWRMEDDCKKLTPQCQFHHLCVKWVSKWFSIIDTMHDPKYKFNYISMVGSMAVI